MAKSIVVALAGNPNSGKTTLFNELTGSHQHVGNYPGVTVEKKEGDREFQEYRLHFVDLPGTYSLSAYSIEELVARDFILEEKPDVVVDVVDASNLERNLYLASMFVELDVPVVLALNMMDAAEAKGKRIDVELLGKLLGVKAVPVVARKGRGLDDLLAAIVEAAEHGRPREVHVNFGPELEQHICELAARIEKAGIACSPTCEVERPAGQPPLLRTNRVSSRWVAISLLENDSQFRQRVLDIGDDGARIVHMADEARHHIEEIIGDDAEIVFADRRYGFASGACREAVITTQQERIDWSERVDSVLTNRLLGLPIFFAFMWLTFEIVFRLGNPLLQLLDLFFTALRGLAMTYVPAGELQSLITDGIIGGVGGVLMFLPNILLLFLAISVLEDSGYMSRAAFVMDRIMHQVGLHGKSFIPMLIGFGCGVPAILATRTLENPRQRIITILVVPLMSCGARLPVYLVLAGAFFSPELAGKMIFLIYALGVLLAFAMARLFSSYLLPGPPTPFVMELPPYRLPTFKGTLIHMWERGWLYVKKAGTTILAMAIVMWCLVSFPTMPAAPGLSPGQNAEQALSHSYAGRVGRVLEPALRPLGFDYKVSMALFAGFAAKEIVVSTMGTIYSLENAGEKPEALREALRADPVFRPLVAFTMMIFVLIYVPCMSAMITIHKETGSWKWTAFTVFYTCGLAWIMSFIVYQGGKLLGL